MDERTLYQTLADAPDDEGHCTVFADWLLERGDPMAEFLALQLEHQRKKLDTLRAQRAQDLLIMNWKRWTGELSRVLHRRACTFERGFLRQAEVRVPAKTSPELLKDAPQWATVRALSITGPDALVASLLESPWLRNLKHLTCASAALAQAKDCAFKLSTLELTGRGARDVHANAAWSQLARLTLEEFVPIERLQLTAREVQCSAASLDGAVTLISGWMTARPRPELVVVRAQDADLKWEKEKLEVTAIDSRQLRALRQLGAMELEVRGGNRHYRGPAKNLDWR